MASISRKTEKLMLAAVMTAALTVGASAADLPLTREVPVAPAPAVSQPVDFTFGTRLQSDYNFRGITQSNHDPSLQGYFEMQLLDNLFYAGISAYKVDLPTRPTMEMDLTAGIRPKLGPFTFDFGVIQYHYPNETALFSPGPPLARLTPNNTDFLEFAGKVSYTHAEVLTLGANVFYSYDYLGTGADGTYVSGTAKYVLPDSIFPAGFAISGEFGHYFLGSYSPQLGGLDIPDYNYWNVGLAYTYKNATLDLRYHDTDLNSRECFIITGDPRGYFTGSARSNWCNTAFIATLSFDFTMSTIGALFEPEKPAPAKEAAAGGVGIR